jgi:hypothetical protein
MPGPNSLWSPTAKSVVSDLTPAWGDIPAKVVNFYCRDKIGGRSLSFKGMMPLPSSTFFILFSRLIFDIEGIHVKLAGEPYR